MAHLHVTADELDDYRWLVGDEAAGWLDRAAANSRPLVAQADRLRKFLAPLRTRLVLEQVELRRRARVKFIAADRMFFTRISLEQATDCFVAAYKAARFPAGEPIADLCCGIGGDLLALARRGPATGLDRDPIAALLAETNLQRGTDVQPVPLPKVQLRGQVRCMDVSAFPLHAMSAWHLDPDRRPEGRRTARIEFHEPGPEIMERLLKACGNAAIKLAPAAEVSAAWAQAGELEWIGRDRQCRQLVVWFGRLAEHPGRRRATIVSPMRELESPRATETPSAGSLLDPQSVQIRTLVGNPPETIPIAPRLGSYLFDPDPAVLAAGLVGTLAAEHGLAVAASGIAYLAGEHPLDDPAMACFQVIDSMPFDLKRLRQWLRERGIGRLEIKKRGVAEEPEQIRRRLHLRGDRAAVLLVAPLRQGVTAILAQRHVAGESG